MSSSYVRTQFKNVLTADFPLERKVDLTAEYDELQNVLKRHNIGSLQSWLGLQFVGNSEEPISIEANNNTGCYREIGAIYLHIVERSRIGVADAILTRAEALRVALRGRRINDIVIEKVSPPNFEGGSTLDFEGGWTSASVIIEYHKDTNL